MTLTPQEREEIRDYLQVQPDSAVEAVALDIGVRLLAALDETFLLLAAIIHSHGGRLLVPTRSLGLIPRRPTVVREDDPDGICFYLSPPLPETKR